MYKVQIYNVAKDTYKTIARIADKQAAIDYAYTLGGTVTIEYKGVKTNYNF